jgi:hypothetical protein
VLVVDVTVDVVDVVDAEAVAVAVDACDCPPP